MIFSKNLMITIAIALVTSRDALVHAESTGASNTIAHTAQDSSVKSTAAPPIVPIQAPTVEQPSLVVPNAKIAWKNSYPVDLSRPVPKPEWLTIIKEDAILNITPNTLTSDGIIQNADPSGNNTWCNWTWDGCVKPTDIVDCTDVKNWGTSFDDGPYEVTRELLSYLKSINVKVTFFVVGKQVITWPEILKQAYDEGHEIGIHTWDHAELTTLSNDMIIGELKWTELAIKEVIGVTPRLMRPPRGDIDDRVRYIVSQLGYTPVMWSVDSEDWRISVGGQTEALLLSNVTSWVNSLSTLTKGGSSLMHDLNKFTVGAALKSLPILHPAVNLSPIGVCAGWKNASYIETYTANGNTAVIAAKNGTSIANQTTSLGNTQHKAAVAAPASVKNTSGSASTVKRNPVFLTAAVTAMGAYFATFFF